MAQPVWVTPAGSIGSFSALIALSYQLDADPVSPATTLTYALLSGSLPAGLTLNNTGLISGTPDISNTTYTFVVRVTDNLGNIRDRTFDITISGSASPEFTTLPGEILTTQDSIWIELPIEYTNPIEQNQVYISVTEGQLPPGLEINSRGLIRGYAQAPILNVNLGAVNTSITSVTSNQISCLSTTGFTLGRPIIFTGTSFSGINAGQTYYIKSVINATTFTISSSVDGDTTTLTNDSGYMTAALPDIVVGEPTIQTYVFTLQLESLLGNDLASYSITVVNQNAPVSIGGPGKPLNTRIPTILNTRPSTYIITENTPYFDYYILPIDGEGTTYPPTQNAFIGKITSDNIFSFKVIGNDFDNNVLVYLFANLPNGLTGDPNTGWITGNIIIADNTISQFSFSVAAYKANNPAIITPYFDFSVTVMNNIDGTIIWLTPDSLGQIENSSVSTLSVLAESDVALEYRLVSGTLPPNLTLLNNGDISGTVAYQPSTVLLDQNDQTTFTFTVEAFSPTFSVVKSTKEFTIEVIQEYVQPTDTLYIKCAPSIQDRNLLRTLLTSEELIPNEYIYRPNDPNFGKSDSVTYVHAYGIFANDLDAYVAAVTKNHYWRNITLGEIKTAVAKNEQGEIIYEVVYSSVIDNLVNPQGVSVSKEIFWPRFIDLNLGPWYTSVSNLYTSYQNGYYTSLTPGYARMLYPNSLPNMREQVGDELGQEFNFRLYPSWMTSQQANGSTLGFTPAWVICYCKPGQITLPNGDKISYAEQIKNNINNNWKTPVGDVIKLNQINFKIDRFAVDKSLTYNYDSNLSPTTWTGLPSGTPVPDPSDSKDFFVLFPRETILPDETQY